MKRVGCAPARLSAVPIAVPIVTDERNTGRTKIRLATRTVRKGLSLEYI